MAEVEDREGRCAARRIANSQPFQTLLRGPHFGPELVRLGPVNGLVDRSGQIGVEEAALHSHEFRAALLERGRLAAFVFAGIREGRGERNAEPVDELLRRQPHPREIVDDGAFEIVGAPANTWVIRAGIVVRTAVIDVVVGAARAQRPTNALAGDRLPTECATEQTAREREIGIAGPPVLGIQNALARVERGPVDEPLIAALVDAAVATKLADVEPVVEDVRKRRAVEARLAGAEDVPFARELVGQRLERLLAR